MQKLAVIQKSAVFTLKSDKFQFLKKD